MLGDQDGWGTNRLSKAESILGTGMSQNLSRGRRHACGADVGGAEIARDASIQVAGWRRVMGKAGSGIAEQVATVATVVFVL